jgi:hypothetical protein
VAANPDTADEIRAELRRTRGRLACDVSVVADDARQLTDWRYYVRRFPWAVIGAAGALGYLAVPRRVEVRSPDVKTLEKLAKRNQLVVETKPQAAQRAGLMDTLLTMTGNVLLRAAVAYAGQHMGKLFGEQAAHSNGETTA